MDSGQSEVTEPVISFCLLLICCSVFLYRTPVIDIKEESDVSDSLSPDRSFPAALDKERNEVNENSKWAG